MTTRPFTLGGRTYTILTDHEPAQVVKVTTVWDGHTLNASATWHGLSIDYPAITHRDPESVTTLARTTDVLVQIAHDVYLEKYDEPPGGTNKKKPLNYP